MKFDIKQLELTEELSISRDIVDFVDYGWCHAAEKQIPVFLFVPKDPDPVNNDHYHIELTKEKALVLKDWLNNYLLDMADFKHPDWVIEKLRNKMPIKNQMERQRRIAIVESNWYAIQERFVFFDMIFHYSEWTTLTPSLKLDECLASMERWK